MKRIDALEIIAAKTIGSLVVCNIGFPCRELCSVNDRNEIFYMLGSMGLSSSIGLGIAASLPDKKVISIDGDGALLMNLGSLVTIASLNLDNFLLVVLDNHAYGSTGFQHTPLCISGDLGKIASSAGITCVCRVNTAEELNKALDQINQGVLIVEIESGNASVPIVPHDPKKIKMRFMDAASQRAL